MAPSRRAAAAVFAVLSSVAAFASPRVAAFAAPRSIARTQRVRTAPLATPQSITTFEAALTTRRNDQSLWDNPRSLKDALGGDVPFASSELVATDCGAARFRVDYYPRGLTGARGAAVYLRYVPRRPGDEVDASFALSVVAGGDVVATSAGCGGAAPGGSPAWRGAMTFCGPAEAVESCGRAADWGAHAWPPLDASVTIRGEIAVWAARSGETSSSLRGAVGAVARAAAPGRDGFRSGEVLVPVADSPAGEAALKPLASGGEYRVMEIAGGFRGGDAATLTVRPAVDTAVDGVAWPVAIDARVPSVTWRNRFDPLAFPARVGRDVASNPAVGGDGAKAVSLVVAWLLSAVAPIPLVLLARTYASVYVIPSESMAPALAKNDVLLVDKVGLRRMALPERGDVVVFDQPPALRELVGGSVAPSALREARRGPARRRGGLRAARRARGRACRLPRAAQSRPRRRRRGERAAPGRARRAGRGLGPRRLRQRQRRQPHLGRPGPALPRRPADIPPLATRAHRAALIL